ANASSVFVSSSGNWKGADNAASSACETAENVGGHMARGSCAEADASGMASMNVQPFSMRVTSRPSRMADQIDSTVHPHNSAATVGATQQLIVSHAPLALRSRIDARKVIDATGVIGAVA